MVSRPRREHWQGYIASGLVHGGLLGLLACSAAPIDAEYGLSSGTPLILARCASVISENPAESEVVTETEFTIQETAPAPIPVDVMPMIGVTAFDRQATREPADQVIEIQRTETQTPHTGEEHVPARSESASPPNPQPVEVKGAVASREPAAILEFPDDETVLVTLEGNGGVEELPRKLRSNPPPAYPPSALTAGQQGRVILNVLVNTRGLVENVSVNESSGFALLDRAALDAVRSWKFSPGKRDGMAISQRVLVPVRFSIRGRN